MFVLIGIILYFCVAQIDGSSYPLTKVTQQPFCASSICCGHLNVASMEQEKWKPVKGFEGLYEVSNLGRVRSLERITVGINGREYKSKGKELKIFSNKGYCYVNLFRNGKINSLKVHRLVAEAFIPNPLNKPQVDHIDTNKNNNSTDNLRWATHAENMNNELTHTQLVARMRDGLTAKMIRAKKDNGSIKGVYQYNLNGEYIQYFESISEAAEATGVNRSTLLYCASGRENRKRAGNFMWSRERRDSLPPYIDVHQRYMKKIAMLGLDMKLIKIFANKHEAAKALGVSSRAIAIRCWRKSTSCTAGGVIVLYEEDYNKLKNKEL
jgi:hypothetical protein